MRQSDAPLLLDELPVPMCGQLCELPPDEPGGAWLPCPGAVVVVRGGVVDDVVVPVLVELVDVAAVAIAAPPPATTAVAATVTSRGLNLRISYLLSIGPTGTFAVRRRSPVGGA
ncbi:MAG: hypothetical protein JO027_00990 [Solirubrobacterales bacterium]|nr:hypothetical protein [Solirubrobacterales bacterium]